MPAPVLSKNPATLQAGDSNDPRSLARKFIAEVDQAIEPLDEYRATLCAKPVPTLHPLMERLKDNGYSDTETDQVAVGKYIRCSCCNAITHAACECPAPLVRAGLRFFSEHPELLKQINGMSANGGDVTNTPADVTKVTSETDQPLVAMTGAERMRRSRAKLAAKSNSSMVDALFPKGSPACDLDWEHDQEEGEPDSVLRARAAKWQMLEAERLAVEFALLRDGTTTNEIKASVHIAGARKIARHWEQVAEKLQHRHRPDLNLKAVVRRRA